ncbi:MAG: tetratricopeptide repeat protein [Bacteroidetes bacterium]|jgi:tetratricopeptide (TPR) repeat protein|nr:tetratricopeptide repeat protein [Bacteroidota bacterium]MBT5530308.1 tetratricopeptide repeat protein [Cytophagia bacterium]MBT3934486.1 tetratricopeptide repeat protein [Bacteroidota bacterium]MBT4339214.1 tetratricopeptide repeat protein [Bacteroidota bacterium]MBT4970856.1 tetratricopeptide repeat protein [Bacteroidota bacterium]
MNEVKIIGYISNPSSLLYKPDVDLLNELKEKYPYFQSAHLLHSIAINQTESVFSNSYLREAAIYAGSRAKMHHYFSADFTHKGRDVVSSVMRGTKSIQNKESTASDALIDRFIKTKPSIKKPISSFYNPAEKASKSIEEEEIFASETLAKIYIMQGRHDKAIKIYQKLSLINPEKSDYFALLIKHLEDKINE